MNLTQSAAKASSLVDTQTNTLTKTRPRSGALKKSTAAPTPGKVAKTPQRKKPLTVASPVKAPVSKTAKSTAVKAPAKTTRTAPQKPVVKKTSAAPAKPLKDKKVKVVRDSFTIPKNELLQIGEMKKRALGLSVEIKKSELIRAGLQALASMPDASFKKALASVPTIKTGRPAKD
jgi:hypothetical protein